MRLTAGRLILVFAIVLAVLVQTEVSTARGDETSESAPPVTSRWRDEPDNPARVRIDTVPQVIEPSDLLLLGNSLFTVSDNIQDVYRLEFDAEGGSVALADRDRPEGMPRVTDLEAMAILPGGEVLIANETTGAVFVLSPFPERVCAAWQTGVRGECFVGHDNCGIEAMAVVPGNRLFVAKERDPRGAYLFDLPTQTCTGVTLSGRTYLKLPEEVGSDISAATYDAVSGHLLVVARSRQKVLELEVPEPTPGDTSPRPINLVGSFSYKLTENALQYGGLGFNQVEGIAVGPDRILYLMIDNNGRRSKLLGFRRGALLRFFPVP